MFQTLEQAFSSPKPLKRHLRQNSCVRHGPFSAAHRLGVGYFLPALFVDRFSKLGGIDRDLFAAQLAGCRSFTDQAWADYWRAYADEQLEAAGSALHRLDGPNVDQILDPECEDVVEQVRDLLSPASEAFTDRPAGPGDSAVAVDALVKAMTYLFAASWPCWTQRRPRAYADSRRLFDVLVRALAPALGVDVEVFTIDLGDDAITGYAVLPSGDERSPAILMTNGLEGMIQEVALPAPRHRPPDTALSTHPRIDADRVGMLGMATPTPGERVGAAEGVTRISRRGGRRVYPLLIGRGAVLSQGGEGGCSSRDRLVAPTAWLVAARRPGKRPDDGGGRGPADRGLAAQWGGRAGRDRRGPAAAAVARRGCRRYQRPGR